MRKPYSNFDHELPYYVSTRPKDKLTETSHLSSLELGIYEKLLLLYYTQGGIPFDPQQLYREARIPKDEQDMAILIRDEFFYYGPDEHWHHKRLDEEIKAAWTRGETKRRGGLARAALAEREKEGNGKGQFTSRKPAVLVDAASSAGEGNQQSTSYPLSIIQDPVSNIQNPINANESANESKKRDSIAIGSSVVPGSQKQEGSPVSVPDSQGQVGSPVTLPFNLIRPIGKSSLLVDIGGVQWWIGLWKGNSYHLRLQSDTSNQDWLLIGRNDPRFAAEVGLLDQMFKDAGITLGYSNQGGESRCAKHTTWLSMEHPEIRPLVDKLSLPLAPTVPKSAPPVKVRCLGHGDWEIGPSRDIYRYDPDKQQLTNRFTGEVLPSEHPYVQAVMEH